MKTKTLSTGLARSLFAACVFPAALLCVLLAVMPEAENEVKATAAEFGIELTAIGELVPARGGRAMVEIR